jgi:hypothetical protein
MVKKYISGIFFGLVKNLTTTLLIPSAEIITKLAAKFAPNYTIFYIDENT